MANTYDSCSCGARKRKISPRCRVCWLSDKESLKQHAKNVGFKKGYTPWNKDTEGLTKWKPERRAKIMAFFEKNGSAMKGKKHSIESRKKTSESMRGEKGPGWKGGITPLNTVRRHTIEHKLWRQKVYERDDYTCQICLKRGGRLEPNHIRPWRSYKELQFDVNNGITLCKKCHELTYNLEEKLIDFFSNLVKNGTKNRVNSGNLLEEMKTLLGKS